ncbi:MAG: low temperature requirement protein A [Thermoleophilia bacterium]
MAQAVTELEGARWFRRHEGGEEQKATTLELFFDLVFVFAITQISHLLLVHLTWTGAGQALFVLLIVWWAWTYTTWMANFMDPDETAVRVLLLAVMLASLLMSIAIPEAFGDRALLFAGAYVALQVVRNLFITTACPPGSRIRGNFSAILVWSVVSGAVYITGAFLDGEARVLVWIAALLIDVGGPAARYWVPGMPRVVTDDWRIDTGHFSERFQLFVIVALGESIVLTGATASGLEMDLARVTAIAVAFIGSAALWWLYFNATARIAGRILAGSEDPGRLARDAYTYLHVPIVAGIIVTAVGDELVIAHPGATLHGPELIALAAGPALYLVGHLLFRLRMAGSISVRRLVAVVVIALLGVAGLWMPALLVASLMTAVLVAVIAGDLMAAMRRGGAAGEAAAA